jgi:hypothetical protein
VTRIAAGSIPPKSQIALHSVFLAATKFSAIDHEYFKAKEKARDV